MSTGIVLDAGALIAIDRQRRDVLALIRRAMDHGDPVVVPAGVIAQAWRGQARQAELARFLRQEITRVNLDEPQARRIGALLARTGTSDVVDASVALAAIDHGGAAPLSVMTSDPDDIRALLPDSRIEAV